MNFFLLPTVLKKVNYNSVTLSSSPYSCFNINFASTFPNLIAFNKYFFLSFVPISKVVAAAYHPSLVSHRINHLLASFDPPFTLTSSDMTENALPMAHTCFNQLVLPSYSTVELLLKRLKLACRHGIAEGFHLT